MTHWLLLILAAASLTIPVSKLDAKVGDKAWAECVWLRAPQSANAWLKASPPKWQDNMETKSELLGFRLVALCDTTPVDLQKPNLLPAWTSLRRVLLQARPKQLAEPSSNAIKAVICESFAMKSDARHLYRTDIYRHSEAGRILMFRQFFGSMGNAIRTADKRGRSVSFQMAGTPTGDARIRMPQDLFTGPAEGYTSDEVCREIMPDGSVANA